MSRRWIGLALLASACATGPAPRAPAASRAPTPAASRPVPPVVEPLPELAFRAGEPPRGAVGLTARVAAPDVIAARVDAIAALVDPKVTVSAEIHAALAAALAGLRLPPDILPSLDARLPIGLVFLMEGLGIKATVCVGAAFKDGAAARAAVDRLGVETARKGAESIRRLPSGKTIHVGVHGRTLLVSTTPGGSALTGPLVEELQAPPAGALAEITFFPRVVIPLDGPGLALAARQLAAADIEKDPNLTPAMARALSAAVVSLAPRLADVNVARLSLDLDTQGGLALRFTLEPVPGSTLGRALAAHAPHVLDARVGLASDEAMVAAWSAPPNVLAAMKEIVSATGPLGRQLGTDLAALGQVGDGSGSCSVELRPSGVRSLSAWRLRPGARPADVLRRYAAYVRSERAFLERFSPGEEPTKIKTAGGIMEIDTGHTPTPRELEGFRQILGGEARYSAATVRGDALFVATAVNAADARAVLASASAPPPSVAAAIAAADARARTADGIVYVDWAVLLLQMMSAVTAPEIHDVALMLRAIPGMTELRLPVELTATTGPSAVYELRVPGTAFESLARLARPYLGTMGKPPSPSR
jgi:hypothetical protein